MKVQWQVSHNTDMCCFLSIGVVNFGRGGNGLDIFGQHHGALELCERHTLLADNGTEITVDEIERPLVHAFNGNRANFAFIDNNCAPVAADARFRKEITVFTVYRLDRARDPCSGNSTGSLQFKLCGKAQDFFCIVSARALQFKSLRLSLNVCDTDYRQDRSS